MTSEYYVPGVQRSAKVKELFTRIAPRYDLLNDLQSFGLHRAWKRRALELTGARPGVRALDICCGTGDLAFGMARRGASVVGLDFSDRMLQVAEARRRRDLGVANEDPNPRFIQGDAQALPFPDNSFDAVTVGYGLRNLADWKTGLREMWRVAAPAGRVVVLDFGKPRNPLWRSVYFGYMRFFVPVLGLVFAGSAGAYSYILESLKH
jgi:demethylmenaquinone methyltransferase / 2-methoxy-6-polyprenyl-1,4-benzoquinol methylase